VSSFGSQQSPLLAVACSVAGALAIGSALILLPHIKNSVAMALLSASLPATRPFDVRGRAILALGALGPIVQTHPVGQPVRLEVVRATAASACPNPTKTLTLDVPVVQNPQNASARMVGVSVEPHLVLPVDVCINAGNIEGPSAGLSWALEIVNQLGPNDLTRGRVIADTGTMDEKGTVGEIGGVAQKEIGAERQAATLFLVLRGFYDVAGEIEPIALQDLHPH